MRTAIDLVFDVVTLALILAAGLPVLLFAINVFLFDTAFGFGYLHDKSVISTAAQHRYFDLGHWQERRLWTNSHILMASVVDDKVDYYRYRLITVEPASGSIFTHSYPLDRASQLNAGARIINAHTSLSMGGVANNWNTQQYHVMILYDGSLIFSHNRMSGTEAP